MSSFSSSQSNKHSSSSSSSPSPSVRHRSLDNIHYLGLNGTDSTWNGVSLEGQRIGRQAVQLANQFNQLNVDSDVSMTSTDTAATVVGGGASRNVSFQRHESLLEEELIERLKELINVFMTRLGRQYAYNTTLRWTVNDGNQVDYSVVLLISQPSDVI